MISVGDLVAVQTTRPEFNSRVYRVESFTASTPRRVVVASADDDTPKRISIREECCTALAIVPFAQTPTTQSPTAQCQLQPLAVPTNVDEQFEMMARFVLGNRGASSTNGPLLDTWIPLPLFGGNMICLVENRDPNYELVMYHHPLFTMV